METCLSRWHLNSLGCAYFKCSQRGARTSGKIRLGLFLSGALTGYSRYPRPDQIGQAIKEAWAWLEGQGLLLQDPRYMQGDMRVLSRKARRLAKESRMRAVH